MAKRKSANSPALAYIGLIRKRIAAIKRDVPDLIALGERMAEPLLDGGNIFPPPVAPFWPDEWSSRAGGMMGLKGPGYAPQSPKDIAYFALPGRRGWDPKQDSKLQSLLNSKAQLFVIGREDELKGVAPRGRFAGFTGGAPKGQGLYRSGDRRPLAPIWPFDYMVRGWITTGEMIAACTRAGRMPILWMSVWLEGAIVRNGVFYKHDNWHEPWSIPMFHDKWHVPPLAMGYAASEFLRELERIVDLLEGQADVLAKAGAWMAAAHRAGRRPWATLVGHSYPKLLELPEENARNTGKMPVPLAGKMPATQYPVEWAQSNSNLRTAVPKRFGKGDVAVHLGYAPVDLVDIGKILDRGVRFVHTSPYGRPAALKNHRNLLWLDLPWRPADATVDIPGYSVRMMPMSSSVETVAFFAMLSEMAERRGWR